MKLKSILTMTRRGMLMASAVALLATPMLGGFAAAQAKDGGTLVVGRPAVSTVATGAFNPGGVPPGLVVGRPAVSARITAE